MTSPKLIMFCSFLLVVGLLVSHIMAGTFFGDRETTLFNTLTVIRSYNIAGLFTIPWLNIDFFLVGIPRLINWDFAFFGGEAAILKYFFYVIAIGLVWGIFPVVAGVISWALRR